MIAEVFCLMLRARGQACVPANRLRCIIVYLVSAISTVRHVETFRAKPNLCENLLQNILC